MLSAAAVGVHLAGWKAYDAGEQGLAQRYYHQSYALAVESGIVGHDAFVLRTLAQQGMKLRHPSKTFALSDTALSRVVGRVDAATEALFTITHAHGLAATNQRRQAVQAVQRARDLLETADGDDMPYWARSWGLARATVNSRSAKVFARLGDRKGAAENYAAAAATRPPTTYARILALDLVAQARMELADGGIEQACGTWNRAPTPWPGCSPFAPAARSVRCARASPSSRAGASQRPRSWTRGQLSSSPDRGQLAVLATGTVGAHRCGRVNAPVRARRGRRVGGRRRGGGWRSSAIRGASGRSRRRRAVRVGRGRWTR